MLANWTKSGKVMSERMVGFSWNIAMTKRIDIQISAKTNMSLAGQEDDDKVGTSQKKCYGKDDYW